MRLVKGSTKDSEESTITGSQTPLARWLDEYGESHQNPTNKLLHWLCVPVITYCVIAFLWLLTPVAASVFMAGALFFYLRLSMTLAVSMAVLVALMLGIIISVESLGGGVLLWTTVVLFVVSLIGQFIGHHIEGKKPSFFKDIQFLLIGPIWLLCFLFRRWGIRYE